MAVEGRGTGRRCGRIALRLSLQIIDRPFLGDQVTVELVDRGSQLSNVILKASLLVPSLLLEVRVVLGGLADLALQFGRDGLVGLLSRREPSLRVGQLSLQVRDLRILGAQCINHRLDSLLVVLYGLGHVDHCPKATETITRRGDITSRAQELSVVKSQNLGDLAGLVQFCAVACLCG